MNQPGFHGSYCNDCKSKQMVVFFLDVAQHPVPCWWTPPVRKLANLPRKHTKNKLEFTQENHLIEKEHHLPKLQDFGFKMWIFQAVLKQNSKSWNDIPWNPAWFIAIRRRPKGTQRGHSKNGPPHASPRHCGTRHERSVSSQNSRQPKRQRGGK